MRLLLCFFCLLEEFCLQTGCCHNCASQKGHSKAPTCISLLLCEVFRLPEEVSTSKLHCSVILKSCFHTLHIFYRQLVFLAVNRTHAHTGIQGQASTPQGINSNLFTDFQELWMSRSSQRFPLLLTAYSRKELFGEALKDTGTAKE